MMETMVRLFARQEMKEVSGVCQDCTRNHWLVTNLRLMLWSAFLKR